jgi:hypothetical protein
VLNFFRTFSIYRFLLFCVKKKIKKIGRYIQLWKEGTGVFK